MEVLSGIEIYEESLFIKDLNLLVFGDLHIGKELALKKSGILVPINQTKELVKKISSIIKITKPKKIVINGDLMHSFGELNHIDWEDITNLIKSIRVNSKDVKITIIKGNHDTSLKPLIDKLKLNFADYYLEKNILICHGDKIPEKINETKTIIIGHQHPLVTLQSEGKSENYKCYLKGKYKKANLIVMPAINPLSKGQNVLTKSSITPFIDESKLLNFEVYILGDKVYYFGKLKNLKNL